jgi:voltage-gated potassium channel
MRTRNQQAYDRFTDATELPMVVLAVLFVPVALSPYVLSLSAAAETALITATWMIWAAFTAEYAVKLYLAPDRRHMVRTHVLDLAIILLPFLRPLRAVRGLRALRALHVGVAVGRAGVGVRRLLSRRGFSAFLAVVGALIIGGGLLAWAFERAHPDAEITSAADGVWWALVTATTVGYGDAVPLTGEGRGVAVLLMLVGISLLSVVTANIAAFFVEEGDGGKAELQQELADLHERFDRLEHLLRASSSMVTDPANESPRMHQRA